MNKYTYAVCAVLLLITSLNNGSSFVEDEDLQKFGKVLDEKLKQLKSEIVAELLQNPENERKPGSVPKARFFNASFGVGVDSDESFLKDKKDDIVYPKNCYQILQKGSAKSGIYTIQPELSKKPFQVLCDMDIQGGGWTHIQKRVDGREDFYRNWRDYKFGFGYLDEDHEFWLGLENIYNLLDEESNELLVELVDRQGKRAFAFYKQFGIGSEEEAYPLQILSGFSGDAGDSLTYQLGMKYSTFDLDQDNDTRNCAELCSGAWWYKNCYVSNLNGKYINLDLLTDYRNKCIVWNTFRPSEYCLAKARMLIKPVVFSNMKNKQP